MNFYNLLNIMGFDFCSKKYIFRRQLIMIVVMNNDFSSNLVVDMLRNYYNIKYLKLI